MCVWGGGGVGGGACRFFVAHCDRSQHTEKAKDITSLPMDSLYDSDSLMLPVSTLAFFDADSRSGQRESDDDMLCDACRPQIELVDIPLMPTKLDCGIHW